MLVEPLQLLLGWYGNDVLEFASLAVNYIDAIGRCHNHTFVALPFLYDEIIAHPAILSLSAENQRDERAYRVDSPLDQLQVPQILHQPQPCNYPDPSHDVLMMV